mmetsp:Transcript_7656/g.11709  ORF Transcript_7656/g.11709 Transcript_7656/m.11709 type:complete len:86 (+) Transcript_7656:1836-2093(+)
MGAWWSIAREKERAAHPLQITVKYSGFITNDDSNKGMNHRRQSHVELTSLDMLLNIVKNNFDVYLCCIYELQRWRLRYRHDRGLC